jgi:MFS family permease
MLKKKKDNTTSSVSLIILYFSGLILAISSALPAYIQSNFLNKFVGLQTLSLFFISANILTVFFIILFPDLIKKLKNFFLTKAILVIYAASLFGLSMANDPVSALISTIFFTVSSNLIWINMDVLVENFSKNSSTGKTRTIYFTFINLGWIFAPALSSYLINLGDYQLPFLVAAFLTIPVFLIFFYQSSRLEDSVAYSKEKITTVIKKTWGNKNLRGIFFVALLLQLFYSTAVVYIPIYLHQTIGIDWGSLGLMFSIMLIPFIIFEIPAGIIADKYLGEKEILFLGFAILAISLLCFFLIKTDGFLIWASILFFSRIGASLVEAMRETYFFKIVDAKDVGYINIFRTAAPLGYIIGPGLAILILAFLPLNYLFLIMAIIMLSGFGFVSSLKDTK